MSDVSDGKEAGMRGRKSIINDKRIYMVAVLAVISVGIIVAMTITAKNKKNNTGKKIIDLNEATTEDYNVVKRENTSTTENIPETTDKDAVENETTVLEEEKVNVIPVIENFAKTKELQWPVVGNIIIDYSMDKTVYFPTLKVYKCNAGIIIQSEVGTDVVSAAYGIVSEIGKNEEIGNYIVMDLGDGYSVTYGQLKNITAKKGDTIEKGKIIGTVAKPTKYYSIEGCNVYFQLDKDGTPIDPVEYFAY